MTPRSSACWRRHPMLVPGCYPVSYPGLAGGPWLWSTLVLFLFHALVVPSGFTTSVQPHR